MAVDHSHQSPPGRDTVFSFHIDITTSQYLYLVPLFVVDSVLYDVDSPLDTDPMCNCGELRKGFSAAYYSMLTLPMVETLLVME